MPHIIDRRKNPKGKNLGNRQRFVRRVKKYIKGSIQDSIQDRSITDVDKGDKVSIPIDDIKEPTFSHDTKTGDKDFVLPGNKKYMIGDKIPKPEGGEGAGSEGSPDGQGEDDFQFTISKDEFLDVVFEDLELPDLAKKEIEDAESWAWHRAGYTSDGTPTNLDLKESMVNSLGRRIALKFPKFKEIHKLEEELEQLNGEESKDEKRIQEIEEKIKRLRRKAAAIGFIDPVDLRFKAYEKIPEPCNQAVMFCIMDVSASMGEFEKDIAKRFFMLLYLFLQRKYDKVDIIFIRHHMEAKECNEEEFFYSKETGGTVVSAGLKLMTKIREERYPLNKWNVYVAQASDGENFMYDNDDCLDELQNKIIPIVQYYAYIEIDNTVDYENYNWGPTAGEGLWDTYDKVAKTDDRLQLRKITNKKEIFSVFRELFKKRNVNADT